MKIFFLDAKRPLEDLEEYNIVDLTFYSHMANMKLDKFQKKYIKLSPAQNWILLSTLFRFSFKTETYLCFRLKSEAGLFLPYNHGW